MVFYIFIFFLRMTPMIQVFRYLGLNLKVKRAITRPFAKGKCVKPIRRRYSHSARRDSKGVDVTREKDTYLFNVWDIVDGQEIVVAMFAYNRSGMLLTGIKRNNEAPWEDWALVDDSYPVVLAEELTNDGQEVFEWDIYFEGP
jgi:hypothetical protein